MKIENTNEMNNSPHLLFRMNAALVRIASYIDSDVALEMLAEGEAAYRPSDAAIFFDEDERKNG